MPQLFTWMRIGSISLRVPVCKSYPEMFIPFIAAGGKKKGIASFHGDQVRLSAAEEKVW